MRQERSSRNRARVLATCSRWSCPLLLVAILSPTACSRSFHRVEQVTFAVSAPAGKLTVRNVVGDVTVVADPAATEIRAEVTKTGRGTTPGEAKRALGQINVELSSSGGDDAVVAVADHPRGTATREYEVEWHLTAPPGVAVEVHDKFGDVEARGFTHGIRLDSDFGDLTAEGGGPIRLDTEFGQIGLVIMTENPEAVRARTDFGDIDVRLPAGRTGRVTADTDFGDVDVRLESVTLRLLGQRRSRFDAELGGEAQPSMELSTDFGDVTLHSP